MKVLVKCVETSWRDGAMSKGTSELIIRKSKTCVISLFLGTSQSLVFALKCPVFPEPVTHILSGSVVPILWWVLVQVLDMTSWRCPGTEGWKWQMWLSCPCQTEPVQ